MNGIGWAIAGMRDGQRVCRKGWNGRNMFLFYVPSGEMDLEILGPDGADVQPFIAMMTVQGTVVPWLCSQTDLLATDWEIAQ